MAYINAAFIVLNHIKKRPLTRIRVLITTWINIQRHFTDRLR